MSIPSRNIHHNRPLQTIAVGAYANLKSKLMPPGSTFYIEPGGMIILLRDSRCVRVSVNVISYRFPTVLLI